MMSGVEGGRAKGRRRAAGRVVTATGVVTSVVGALGLLLGWGDPKDSPTVDEAAARSTTTALTSTTSPAPTAADAADFAVAIFRAIATDDEASLVEDLDPLVTGLFGVDACRRHVGTFQDTTRALEDASATGPQDYTYTVDGVSFVVPAAWSVRGTATVSGERTEVEVHVGTAAGRLSWFTDCGTPLPAEQRQLPKYAREVRA